MRIERFEKGILERSLSWFKMMSFGEDLVMVASAGMMPSLGSWLTLPGKFVWPHTVALDLNTVALDDSALTSALWASGAATGADDPSKSVSPI